MTPIREPPMITRGASYPAAAVRRMNAAAASAPVSHAAAT